MEVRFPPERAAVFWGFGDVVLVLYHQPLVNKWKHHRVRQEK